MISLQATTIDFLNFCKFEKSLCQKTLKAYQIDLRQLCEFIQKRGFPEEVSCITKNEIRYYLESIATLKPKTIKRKVATIRVLFNYLEFEDVIKANPMRKMRIRIKEYKTLPRVLNIGQISDIFKSAYQNKEDTLNGNCYSLFETLRNVVVIELLFATGARVSELSNLMDNMIDVNSGEITIKGKGNKERIIQVCNKETIQILRKYRKENIDRIKKSGGFFLVNRMSKMLSDQSIRAIVKRHSQATCLNMHVTPHVFRHTFATLLLEKDVDIKYIQSLLGHSSIMTTQIYTHVNREKQKQILKSKHPRRDFSLMNFNQQ